MVRRTSKSHWPPIVIIHLCARKMLITQFGSHVAIHYFAKYAWEKRLSRESCTWFFKILNWQDKHPRQRYMMLFKHRGGKSFEYRFTAFCDRAFVYNSFFLCLFLRPLWLPFHFRVVGLHSNSALRHAFILTILTTAGAVSHSTARRADSTSFGRTVEANNGTGDSVSAFRDTNVFWRG